MKIAILSDSHDNLPNIYKALDYINKHGAEMIIHCGDIAAAGVLKEIAEKFSGPIHLVLGNVTSDLETLKMKSADYKHVKVNYDDPVELKAAGKKIAFTHYPETGRQLAESGKYDYVFYGHSHKPWQEKIKNTQLINPGTLGGLFNKATFALWDTKKEEPELIILEKI